MAAAAYAALPSPSNPAPEKEWIRPDFVEASRDLMNHPWDPWERFDRFGQPDQSEVIVWRTDPQNRSTRVSVVIGR